MWPKRQVTGRVEASNSKSKSFDTKTEDTTSKMVNYLEDKHVYWKKCGFVLIKYGNAWGQIYCTAQLNRKSNLFYATDNSSERKNGTVKPSNDRITRTCLRISSNTSVIPGRSLPDNAIVSLLFLVLLYIRESWKNIIDDERSWFQTIKRQLSSLP